MLSCSQNTLKAIKGLKRRDLGKEGNLTMTEGKRIEAAEYPPNIESRASYVSKQCSKYIPRCQVVRWASARSMVTRRPFRLWHKLGWPALLHTLRARARADPKQRGLSCLKRCYVGSWVVLMLCFGKWVEVEVLQGSGRKVSAGRVSGRPLATHHALRLSDLTLQHVTLVLQKKKKSCIQGSGYFHAESCWVSPW